MPSIYLSPSTQEYNPYICGGNEEMYMNLIADEMEPWLISNGISFTRNTPDMTAASSIAQSNEGNYDLHLALHSNAAPPALAGTLQGSIVFYNPDRSQSKRAAEILADYLRQIYPQPDLVSAQPTDYLGEVLKTKAPRCTDRICLPRQLPGRHLDSQQHPPSRQNHCGSANGIFRHSLRPGPAAPLRCGAGLLRLPEYPLPPQYQVHHPPLRPQWSSADSSRNPSGLVCSAGWRTAWICRLPLYPADMMFPTSEKNQGACLKASCAQFIEKYAKESDVKTPQNGLICRSPAASAFTKP